MYGYRRVGIAIGLTKSTEENVLEDTWRDNAVRKYGYLKVCRALKIKVSDSWVPGLEPRLGGRFQSGRMGVKHCQDFFRRPKSWRSPEGMVPDVSMKLSDWNLQYMSWSRIWDLEARLKRSSRYGAILIKLAHLCGSLSTCSSPQGMRYRYLGMAYSCESQKMQMKSKGKLNWKVRVELSRVLRPAFPLFRSSDLVGRQRGLRRPQGGRKTRISSWLEADLTPPPDGGRIGPARPDPARPGRARVHLYCN